jgi:hypothetical protein
MFPATHSDFQVFVSLMSAKIEMDVPIVNYHHIEIFFIVILKNHFQLFIHVIMHLFVVVLMDIVFAI